MADLLLSFAANELLLKLQSVVTDRVTAVWGLKDDLEKLSDLAGRLRSLLKKAQFVVAAEDDDSIKRWLEKLQEAVYAAADVVDEFQYEILRRKVEVKGQMKGRVRNFVSGNNHVLFCVKMAVKVKEVGESLFIMEKQAPLVLLTMTIPTVYADRGAVLDSHPDRRTDSFLGERPIGRTEDAERIIQMLKVSSDEAFLFTVISIVGFGGLGKTTLAQLVFEKVKTKKLFDEMMWVCVSEPFDAHKILGEMLEKLDKTTGGLRNMDVIVSELQHHLKDRRFLLVLDDVWNNESAKWDTLKTRLEKICGKRGNFVVATTRGSDVARIMQSKHVVKLKQLSDTECWNIIKEKVVGISREMEAIGTTIANKCGGVPLVAKVISGVLSSRSNKEEWLSILGNEVWNEVDDDKKISRVLKLSFDHLPQSQRLCFAYCSLFPKDFVFEKTQLIQLWMAEDFLNPSSTNEGTSAKLMEDVGDEYFHNLYANSFFQDAEVDDYGSIIRCKMHDLLHDLASSISKSQRLQCGSNCCETSSGRRLSFSCDQVSKVEEILKKSEEKTINLRCLFCRVDVSTMLSNFRRLRSLDMSNAKLKDIPGAIRKLKHLRYLDISKNETIQELPESITKLYNLQTLRVFKCKSLKELPSKIRNLVSLRHLGIDDKRLMPLGVGCLTNLQTLSLFAVGLQMERKIDELGGLRELRGELLICGLENVRDKEEAERARIKEKKLSKLVLQWMEVEENEVGKCSSFEESLQEEVMGGLEAPTNLESLKIEWYMGKQFSQWMSQLQKLVELRLENCRRCVRMPTLAHLPNLKLLVVKRTDSIKSIGTEFYGDNNNMDTLFPSLEEFSIEEMKNLSEWVTPKGSEIFPKLRRLRITDCPYLETCLLSQSISSPIYMRLRSSSVGIADLKILCNFMSVEYVWIQKCPKLTFPRIGLTSLLHFYFDFGDISQLEDELVKNFSVSSKELDESWKMLRLEGCVERIREFPKSLEALEIESFHEELSLEAFHELSYLKHLVIRDLHHLVSIPNLSSLISLENLQIRWCNLVKSIPNLSSLTSLKHLEIESCYNLESVPTLSSLTSLEHLQIRWCNLVRSMPTMSSLTSLKYLEIEGCYRLESVPTLSSLTSLEHLQIGGCSYVNSIPSLSSLTSLKHLQIESGHILEFISTLSSLTSLEHLQIGDCDSLESIPNVSSLRFLKELHVSSCNNLSSVPDGLISCQSLKKLVISRCGKLSELRSDSFSTLTCLELLSITYCGNLRRIPRDIKSCPSLKVLKVAFCEEIVSIDDNIIGSLAQLKELEWGGFSEEVDEIPGLNTSLNFP